MSFHARHGDCSMYRHHGRNEREGKMDKWMDRAEWMLSSIGILIVLYIVIIFVAAIL